jgi:hypothetical protein
MYDDEAATGVAYELHDPPTLERAAEARQAERDDDRPPATRPLPRRFLRGTTPVEPMS